MIYHVDETAKMVSVSMIPHRRDARNGDLEAHGMDPLAFSRKDNKLLDPCDTELSFRSARLNIWLRFVHTRDAMRSMRSRSNCRLSQTCRRAIGSG